MTRALRPRAMELAIGYSVAFGIVAAPCLVERIIGRGESPRAHSLDLTPLIYLLLAFLGQGLTLLVLPFTRWVRLAGPFDAAQWGVAHALGGLSALAGWAAWYARPGEDLLSEDFLVIVIIVVTVEAVLAPGLQLLAVRQRPALACEPRSTLPLGPRLRLPLLALASLLLGAGLFVIFLLATSKLGWRGANPYLMGSVPFLAALASTSFFFRRQLDSTRSALLYGASYGAALGLLHALWIVMEMGRISDKGLFLICLVLPASTVVSALLALGASRLARGFG